MAAKMESDSSSPSARDKAVYTVLRFIGDSIKDDSTSDDSKESLEVAMECLQAVFGMNLNEVENSDVYKKLPSLEVLIEDGLSDGEKHVEAERLKNEGNTKLKNEQYDEAISLYTKAITLSPSNPPYYANRAAAYIKIEELHKALDDCQTAVGLKPDYARAHGRMGFIFSKLSRTQEARAAYQKAVECDPNNLEYKSALQGLGETPPSNQAPPMPGGGPQMPFDINNLLSNPGFMNLASSVMSNPMFQNMATRMFQQAPPPGQAAPFGQQAPPTGQSGEGGAETGATSNPNPPPPAAAAGPPPPFLGMNFANMMPHLAEMGRQMQENDPVAFEDFRQRASTQFAATHNDEPTPPKDKEDKN